jgi:uncharacterized membrane protein
MAWTECAAAWGLFLISHALPIRPPLRPWLVDRLGQTGFRIAYSALSVVALGWLIEATARAPFVVLWNWAPWQPVFPQVGMALALALIALAVGRPNPFSFGGWNDPAYNPDRPGILRLTRHPILMALAIWAGTHIVPNGDLAHVLLFGGFAIFALLGMKTVDRRKQQAHPATWQASLSRLHEGPLLWSDWPVRKTAIRLVLAALAYLTLASVHSALFGVEPFP